MRRILLLALAFVCLTTVCTTSCRNDKIHHTTVTPDYGNFPDAVGKIIINKCATAGCHNAASYVNSGGLLLDSWAHLFDGGGSGAEVVPYSPDFSPLLYFVNTDSTRGTVALPTMPYSPGGTTTPLSADEYNTLKTWISNGAPDKNGNIPFASEADTRQKIYLTQQGCDLVAVIDAKTNLVMRYISVGSNASATESPHCLRTSADGKYAYISFLNGSTLPKIDTRTDAVISSANIGAGSWNILFISPANDYVTSTDWTANGKILYTKTSNMTVEPDWTGSGSGFFVFPHGITSDATFDTCFITAQYGNVVYRYAPKVPHYKKISINGLPPATTSTPGISPDPHEILMAPDYSKYFLTCEGTNEIRVMNAHSDAVMAVIPVGKFPQEMAISKTQPYLFVTCMEDPANTTPGSKGSVYVINYNTLTVVETIYGDFYQPHGIAVDDKNGKVLIASSNANPGGPAPHHATACGGRAGWYSMYSLNTLKPLNNRRYQVTVMPYSADVRFKN